ncbi:GvpL/GvpF family gas vesicle protein [Streptomyces atratus]|uniref:GvpL/GvpF family gas vesicle protein n=1 Tax=Streptomyces atratus TaxID=1893 RepID=UPI0022515455|nr:GvpL/GvpF family gas vesicle protein [Streptomyces atratus]MCX5345426.1 GvpL/GvpF family gas vesicle protein [Streptomyces atratus]
MAEERRPRAGKSLTTAARRTSFVRGAEHAAARSVCQSLNRLIDHPTDEETVRGQLAVGETGHIAALVEYLSDTVEVNVKALPAQNALASLVAEDKKVRQLLEEARRRPGCEAGLQLGEAVVAALESRATEAGRRVLRELTPMARAVATGLDVQGCVLKVPFLVNCGDRDDFRSVAERFADAHRDHVELRLAGPLPCYGFVAAEGTYVRAAGV